MTKRPFFSLTLLLILTALACNVASPPQVNDESPWVPDPPQLDDLPADTGRVIDVIDGDTIDVRIDGTEYRIRYIGIDTPERGEVCYDDATTANAALVANQTVRLVKDVSETDRYGRLLRYVYVENLLINAELVAGGYAESKAYNPDTTLYDFLETLETDARRSQRGCYPTGIFSR